MKMITLPLMQRLRTQGVVAASFLCCLLPLASRGDELKKAADAPEVDCVRFQEKDGKAMLQTVVRTLVSPKGQTVDLIGAVHIADKAYYESLNERFGKYDAVLYEMVGEPAAAAKLKPQAKSEAKETKPEAETETSAEAKQNPLRMMQKMIGGMLRLTFQLEEIDYTKPNFIHADMSQEEFSAEMKKRGESFMTMFAEAMKAEQAGGNEMTKELEEMDMGQMLMMMMSGKGTDNLKVVLAKAFDKSENMLQEFEGDKGSAILGGRNDKALAKLREVLKSGKTKLSLFYGAGHLVGMQQQLVKEGWKVTGEVWLPAWSMTPTAKAKAKAKEATAETTPPAGK